MAGFRGVTDKHEVMEKHLSFGGAAENSSSSLGVMEKNPSFHGMEWFSQIYGETEEFCSDVATSVLMVAESRRETPLYAATANRHAVVVTEMPEYMNRETASVVARNWYDPLHVEIEQGRFEVLKPNLVMITDFSYATARHTAATQAHDIDLDYTVLHSAAGIGALGSCEVPPKQDPGKKHCILQYKDSAQYTVSIVRPHSNTYTY
ncbi:unnamed protein product [Dovyalis caffra]|uniref:Uncharacterized protein n=1 Tax=Dovyalis caffra TaxID=77055 RepID=A0AAV1S994_9ROSI|nr:unnamed protein product [Dovyalis caffra]